MIDLLIALGAGAVAAVMAYLFGRRDGKKREQTQQRVEQAKREAETGRRIDDGLAEDDAARKRGDSWVDRLRRAGQ